MSTWLVPSPAAAETREEYLARLRAICEVECLQPRQFQRTARKRKPRDDRDMAIIMDVAEVRITGDRITLYDKPVGTSPNAGDGSVRSRQADVHPNVLAIELTWETVFDLLTTDSGDNAGSPNSDESDESDEGTIIVEGRRIPVIKTPYGSDLRNLLRNRRVVVRGTPRLEVRIVGARRDFHRKQVILEVASADDLILLPRYDKDGEPVYGGEFDLAGAQTP